MKLFNRKSKSEKRFEHYAKNVLDACAIEFEWDDMTKDLAWRNMQNPTDHFEFICDHPVTANYKLKFSRGRFRLAYYGYNLVDDQHRFLHYLLECMAY